MKPALKAKTLKFLRMGHGWLGLFVFPWIVVIGLTGIYQNHSKLVLGWIGSNEYDESLFSDWAREEPLSVVEAARIVDTVWPAETAHELNRDLYHGFDSYEFKKNSGKVIVLRATGHYYVKTSLTRRLFNPEGFEIHKKIYWGAVFSWLHERGWLSNRFGTWLADITAGAMAVFGISGIFLFFMPRAKKISRGLKKRNPFRRRVNV